MHDSEGLCAVVHHAAYRILRQSRPSLRRWRASSSGWPCPRRRRRRLPPAAAPLETTAAPQGRGQHRAAASNNRACGPTLGDDDATLLRGSSASASLRTAPERDAESGGTAGGMRLAASAVNHTFKRFDWLAFLGEGHVMNDGLVTATVSREINRI